ncbi:tetratricopeptide repeat protein [Sphingomonas sp.]|uniref:tetratricopeptide repeat protein n=1 Tax=Sphingomonas sp. TaxID=28214 RepID=UPI0017C3B82B|nr:tetratricopeptide repeat protein [Sphingomonas sp.]MBA3511804.1 tetratricopeptide repeat protein [Sphingomonas sp.]
MLSLLLAAAVASASPPANPLSEAAHAIDAGRLEQARKMIANAVAAGTTGPHVERLLADLAYKSGRNAEALARYQALLAKMPSDALLAERAGIAALKSGDKAAAGLLARATASPAASWRAWNARGVAADLKHDWADADAAYSEAASRAPEQAEVQNNRGWSKLLRGDWSQGLKLLKKAAKLDPRSTRIANNLELARTALAEDLPRRRAGESSADWAARLNDAGVAARLRGDKARAIAAFARAIEARDIWYERAANNLAIAERAQ